MASHHDKAISRFMRSHGTHHTILRQPTVSGTAEQAQKAAGIGHACSQTYKVTDGRSFYHAKMVLLMMALLLNLRDRAGIRPDQRAER